MMQGAEGFVFGDDERETISGLHQDRVRVKNMRTNPADRVKAFSFKASGGSYAKLFDGTEKLLSWDNILWINRSVLAP